MSKNGMASYGKSADYVSLTHLPTPKSEYVVNFEKLTGGLNIFDPDYRLATNESPDMENMLWKNGTLCSRYGQSYVDDGTDRGKGYTCFEELFWDYAFFHIGNSIWYGKPGREMTLTELCDLSSIYNGYVPARGTFLRYVDDLVYKAPGVFVRIHYTPPVAPATEPTFTATDVAGAAYTPITVINASWKNGAGTLYQPENRISAKKTVWYNAGTEEQIATFSGDGTTTDFTITLADFVYVTDVTVDGQTVGNWTVSGTTLHFYLAPASGTNNIQVKCQCAVKTYYLPVKATSIEQITVDGVVTTAYTYDSTTGCVTFTSAPPVTQPLSANTVRITYIMANDNAFSSIMGCPYAIVYGGNQNICMVVGGCEAQPNAFFWNGNNIAMDLSYWPMEHYNLGGDTEDMITGFGRQQGNLVVFKHRSVGKVTMTFTSVNMNADGTTARTFIEMDYTSINSKLGCDIPWTIQLIDNNLVFTNSQQGVHFIADSSAAYENNIIDISKKVNGDNGRVGLLQRIRDAQAAGESISSFDDTKRYWIIAGTKVYCWDYKVSDHKNPSWFYLTGIDAPNMLMDAQTIYHVGSNGRVTVFDNSYADYRKVIYNELTEEYVVLVSGDFERRYQFATQFFRSYDRLKTVTTEIFTFRPDTDFQIRVTYMNDYEERDDLTNIVCRSWRLVPRNLLWRELAVVPFAYVARRRPGCRHVRHFSTVLRCTGAGYDMPLLSAQVFYKYEGRDR